MNRNLLIPILIAGALAAGCKDRDATPPPATDSTTPTTPGAGDQSTTPGGNAGDTTTTPGTPDAAAPPPADTTSPPADTTQPSDPPPQK